MSGPPTVDPELIERLPCFLAVPLRHFAAEGDPEKRLHRLCDAVEICVRFCTVLAVGELRSPDEPGKLPAALVQHLGPNIETPTFARWLGMAGALADFLSRDRSAPTVLPGLPRFIREVLLPCAPRGCPYLDASILEVRNTLAHGGAMSAELADRLLQGDTGGPARRLRSEVPLDAEEEDEAGDAQPAAAAFHGWEAVLVGMVGRLADLLAGSRVCSFDGEAARDLTGTTPRGEADLSADLGQALRGRRLADHVLLLREGRWLDLWPLCDHGKARLMTLRGPTESEDDAPLLYYRGEPRRLLYAAFGVTPPVSERGDAVAAFQALFRTEPRQARAPEAAADFTEELRRDSRQLVGRAEELAQIKDALARTDSGVLWLSGAAGAGKSFLTARVAVNKSNSKPEDCCCIAWRFRVGDAHRSNPTAFLRHAVTRLVAWPVLGCPEVRPDLDSGKLPAQFNELLRRVGGLRPSGGRTRPPQLLFVLDSMDEAARLHPDLLEWPFRFSGPNVVWLCSGRPEEAPRKAFAAGRCTVLFPDGLPPMSAGDVRALLYQQLGEQKYELLGLDRRDRSGKVTNPLVEAIVERSEGLPLYVRFLVEDLLAGHFELTARLKSKLPQGLAAYYDNLLARTGIGDVEGLLPDLLALIVWGQGPVTEELLFELLRRQREVQPALWDRLRSSIREGLRRVGSLVRAAAPSEGGLGHEPYHTTFRDHFRADRARLELTNDRACVSFVRLTIDWRDVPETAVSARRYLFRHGPQHLLDAGRYQELIALARDEEFLRAQTAGLPDEPEAPLRTLRAALTGAARQDDAAGMAEFLLAHAERTEAVRGESPLAALRRGSLERALRLADLAEPEQAVLHRLLLAWELCDAGRTEEAQQVLTRLSQGQVPVLADDLAAAALECLVPLSRDLLGMIANLVSGLLDETRRGELLVRWVTGQPGARPTGADRADACEQVLRSLGPVAQAQVLQEVAAAQARAGDLDPALRTAHSIEGTDEWAPALTAIATALAEAGRVEAALRAAAILDDPVTRAPALKEIAIAQARAGTVEAALQTADGIALPRERVLALQGMAASLASADRPQLAQDCLDAALRAVTAVPEAREKAELMGGIAVHQVKARLPQAALATACRILVDREQQLPALAEALLDAHERAAFKELLLPCAVSRQAAWTICALLPEGYPEQSAAVARVVLRFTAAPAAQ